jgi:membrane protease YdiL (CAAX protease family)
LKTMPKSTRVFLWLVLILSIFAGINVFLPQGSLTSSMSVQNLPTSKPVFAVIVAVLIFVIYGFLGLVGLKLSRILGFAEIWDESVSNKERFIIPLLTGAAVGIIFIFADQVFSKFHNLGLFPHPPFPTSLVASLTAGIGEEIIFRLFFVSFWMWIVSKVILRNRWSNPIFWVVSIFSALAFALGHMPTVMVLYGFTNLTQIPAAIIAEVITLNGIVGLIAAYYLRRYGFIAAVGIHFWTDIIWHVIWGLI